MAIEGEDGGDRLVEALDAYLAPRLSALGLDPDIYGPYLRPVLLGDTDEIEDLEEEWGTVLGLLQASSETHADDEECWRQLRREAEEESERLSKAARQEREEQRRLAREAQDKERERAECLSPFTGRADPTDHRGNEPTSAPDDAAKRALLARFAYEESDEEDEANEEGGKPVAAATTASIARNGKVAVTSGPAEQAARPSTGTNKQLERQKTKQAKEAKVAAKEERRKRAVKGERRR